MIFVSLLLTAATPSMDTNILVQLSAGKMLCSNPDVEAKTCSAIASYVQRENGAVVETSEVLLSFEQELTLEATSAAYIEGSMVCGIVNEAELRKGIVRSKGSPLPPKQNAAMLNKLAEKLRPMEGRKVCEELRVEGGSLMKYGWAEGIDANVLGKPVRWISSDEGYKVAPR